MKRYDYIIAGGGLAGLSLAYALNQSVLRTKSILIIDKEKKDTNNRTWCFWEKENDGPFESIVNRRWKQVDFYGPNNYTTTLPFAPYTYKWIRGLDFYRFVQADLLQNPSITFLNASIERIKDTPDGGFVITEEGQYIADYVFDSITPLKMNLSNRHNMLQHFKGWIIKSPRPVFDPQRPIMMDYRVPQKGIGVRFGYVLPLDAHSALVEYTLFSDKLLQPDEYEEALKGYLHHTLTITDYSIEEEEFGVIPMTDELPNASSPHGHIIRIGTSGGYVKASSGYAFARTQRMIRQLVAQLLIQGKPSPGPTTLHDRFKLLLDSTLLNVLLKQRAPGDKVFSALYQKNPTPLLLSFLDEDTSLWQDLRVMQTVPIWPFMIGFFDVLWKRATTSSY